MLNSQVFSTFRGAIISKDITLSKHFTSDVPAKVIGDRSRIEHVISNLLSNAIKFSNEGESISVSVAAESLPPLGSNNDENKDRSIITITILDEGTESISFLVTMELDIL